MNSCRLKKDTHSHSEILSLYVTGADILGIRFAYDSFFLAGRANRGAVALLCLWVIATALRQVLRPSDVS